MESASAFNFQRAAQQLAAAPDRNIHWVNAPAGDESQGKLGDEPPGFRGTKALAEVLRIGPEGGGPEPALVVEAAGYGKHFGGAAGRAGRGPDVDVLQFADAAVAHQFAGQSEGVRGTLLGAELEDALATVDFLAQRPVLRDVDAERLFHIDVFAGANRGQRRQHVPMVGRGNQEGVNVLASDDLLEVGVGLAILVLVLACSPCRAPAPDGRS